MTFVQYYKHERILKARRKRKPEWQKRLPHDTPAGREAYAIAAKHENKFARAFLEATQSLLTNRIAADFNAVWRAGGGPEKVMATLPFFGTDIKPEVWDDFIERILKAYSAVIQEAGEENTEEMNRKFRTNMKFSLEDKEEIPVVPINPYSIEWVRNRSLELAKQGISDQQREVVRDIIDRGFSEGVRAEEAYGAIKKNIGLTHREYNAVINREIMLEEAGWADADVKHLTEKYRDELLGKRAMRIARTETMFAQAQGRNASWQMAQDSGILPPVVREWVAVPGACEICGELDGQEAPVGGAYESTEGPVESPPAHPNCLPGDAAVLASGVSASSKRWYDGDLVILTTALGNKLACTPNHPILTMSGWKAAHLLNVGDDVISYIGGESVPSSWFGHNQKNMPVVRDKISNLAKKLGLTSSVPVPGTSKDFHGDGNDADVTIIRTKSLLWSNFKSSLFKHFGKLKFFSRRMSEMLFACKRSFKFLFMSSRLASNGIMSSLCSLQPFAFAQALHVDSTGFALPSNANSFDFEKSPNNIPADAPDFSQRLLASSSDIVADNVINVDVQRFSGHVYNLQCLSGYYISQNIISHNCACTEILKRAKGR